jgi:hypothetical protein
MGNEKESQEDFRLGAQYGNDVAKAMVKNNPYAKLCNNIVSLAMAELNAKNDHHS